ncbi:polymorphic toxin type 44 domain-containing protein [Klebsiella pneumoniae]|nr:polymorphic toxin type 44 domain-containing protein [Klebsiella pneumoniae]
MTRSAIFFIRCSSTTTSRGKENHQSLIILKFKQHDYFYDVWSNIHYGYVGRSVGFSEAILLKRGPTWEQNMTPGAMGMIPWMTLLA